MARLSHLLIAVALVSTTAMSPVTRVSELLKELSAKVENDGKTEETGGAGGAIGAPLNMVRQEGG